jgi:predicted dehydrogenase
MVEFGATALQVRQSSSAILLDNGVRTPSVQRMQFLGTKGRIEIEIPFNAPNDRPCRIFVDDGRDVFGGGVSTETFPICDQYTIQGDIFSRVVRGEGEVPVSIEDAIGNMAVLEAVFRSAETGRWERPLGFRRQ